MNENSIGSGNHSESGDSYRRAAILPEETGSRKKQANICPAGMPGNIQPSIMPGTVGDCKPKWQSNLAIIVLAELVILMCVALIWSGNSLNGTAIQTVGLDLPDIPIISSVGKSELEDKLKYTKWASLAHFSDGESGLVYLEFSSSMITYSMASYLGDLPIAYFNVLQSCRAALNSGEQV